MEGFLCHVCGHQADFTLVTGLTKWEPESVAVYFRINFNYDKHVEIHFRALPCFVELQQLLCAGFLSVTGSGSQEETIILTFQIVQKLKPFLPKAYFKKITKSISSYSVVQNKLQIQNLSYAQILLFLLQKKVTSILLNNGFI